MKAEKDDMPEYLRSPRKPAPWTLLIIVGIAAATAWTVGMQLKNPIHMAKPSFNQEQKKAEIVRYRPAPPPAPEPIKANAQRRLSTAEIEWFEQAAREGEQRRQTSFNDQNYQPRGAVNSIPPPQRIAYTQPERASKRQTTRITHTANWTWENGHQKKRTGGNFRWTEVNGAIDWSTVCSNYRSGSLEYRDCRKGAKVAFRRMCSGHRPACAAENNFMP